MNNPVLHNSDTQRFAEACAKTALDISEEKETVLSFTSQDSYRKKIELISAADDMTTAEKLVAINQAEERRLQDIRNGVETCKNLMWNRYLLVFSCLTGITLLAISPEGSKVIMSVFKRVA